MKTVRDVLMHKTQYDNFILPGATVIEALRMMKELNLSYLIVKVDRTVYGIFSERDYARKVILEGRTSSEARVKEIMSTDLPHVQINEPVEVCMKLLASHGMRYVIVMDGENFAGVITIHDLLREILLNKAAVFDDYVTRKLIDINERGPKVY